MRSLIQNRDLRTIFGGVSIAAAAGLLTGAAMYPKLDVDKLGGPQILTQGGGPRGDLAVADRGVGAYGGRVPDYVIGTDALRPAPELSILAYEDDPAPATPEPPADEEEWLTEG